MKKVSSALLNVYHLIIILGILLHYDEGRLSDLYFVDPQWLCSMLAKVIAVPEVNSLHKNGVLVRCSLCILTIVLLAGFIGRTELDRIFGDRSHVNECIDLMQKFDLLFELDSSYYLVPSLLPPFEYQSCVVFPRSLKIDDPRSAANDFSPEPAAPMGSHSNCLVRLFMLPFIPNGMFPRLSARLIATDVIEHVLSSLKITSQADNQQFINQLHWRVWRNGITLVYRSMQIFRVVPMNIPLPGVDVVHVLQPLEQQQPAGHGNAYKGVSIMVHIGNLSDDVFNKSTSGLQMSTWLLQQAAEQINSVFEDWYEEFAWKRSIDLNVVAADPCPQCMTDVYKQLVPDLPTAQRRQLVGKSPAMEMTKKEKKKSSFLQTMTLLRKPTKRYSSETNVSLTKPAVFGVNRFSTWSSSKLRGQNKKVVYLFSVKLSALSVMETTSLTCPTHGSISIAQVAPDMVCKGVCVFVCVSI